MHQVRGRVVAVSERAAMIAGGWIGFALGLVIGCVLGAGLAWFAGAILSWQRDLSLTLGVTGLFSALVGALIGGLVAVSYNRSPFGVQVVVEVPDSAP